MRVESDSSKIKPRVGLPAADKHLKSKRNAKRQSGEVTERTMEAELSLEFLRVVENAAIAAARTMGFGDRHKADEGAVEGRRKAGDSGEGGGPNGSGAGGLDEGPELDVGEKEWVAGQPGEEVASAGGTARR